MKVSYTVCDICGADIDMNDENENNYSISFTDSNYKKTKYETCETCAMQLMTCISRSKAEARHRSRQARITTASRPFYLTAKEGY